MIAMVNQDCNLRDIHTLASKVIDIGTEHLNQSLIIRDTSFGAMSKEWKP